MSALDDVAARLAAEARVGFARSPMSQFVARMQEVMRDYLAARQGGLSREDAVRGIEAVLRAEWPGRPTKYPSCDGCDGTGWHLRTCDHRLRCGRRRCAFEAESFAHTYAVPCDCVLGDKFRRQAKTMEDELAAVGRRKKKSGGFTRLGA